MSRHGHGILRFSPNADYDFEIRTVIGHAAAGAADIGEVLAATAGIPPHDHRAWYAAWDGLASRVARLADEAASAGHRFSASQAYLRAAVYSGVAVNAMSALEENPEEVTVVFRRHRASWDAFVAFGPTRAERIDIPFELGSLPGYLFRPAPELATGATLVAVNGSDGSIASLWATCAQPALARGYNVLLFDGPGQQSQLFERNLLFRPDWEHVLTPVYEYLARQQGVDPSRICLYGISQGGYWVARALAFEHRFAAAVTDPGLVDVSSSWIEQLPKSLVKLLDEGKRDAFDREMALGMHLAPATARTWRFRARPYGADGYAATIDAVRTYTVADVAQRIRTPLLILDPEGEQFWPGQAERLAALTSAVSTRISFTEAEGASGHCEPLARGRVAECAFDWIERVLDARTVH